MLSVTARANSLDTLEKNVKSALLDTLAGRIACRTAAVPALVAAIVPSPCVPILQIHPVAYATVIEGTEVPRANSVSPAGVGGTIVSTNVPLRNPVATEMPRASQVLPAIVLALALSVSTAHDVNSVKLGTADIHSARKTARAHRSAVTEKHSQ